jgi:hypothetical protein
MTIITETRFRDIARREALAFDALVNTSSRLAALKRPLSKAETEEKALVDAVIAEAKKGKACDPLFVATRALIIEQKLFTPDFKSHQTGQLTFAAANPPPSDDVVTQVALTIGILAFDAADPPPVVVTGSGSSKAIEPNRRDPRAASFTRAFFNAVGEARGYGLLARKVLTILALEGDPDGVGGVAPAVETEEFARVMRGLAERKVADDEPQLRRRVNEALNKVQNIGFEDSVADLGIDLPDLDDIYDQNIVAENVRAMGPMIVSAMFEELKVFQVVDRIVEQFQQGMLPIGPGNAGRMLYRYWRETPNRISEQERRNFASITLGIPGGDPGAMVNREFNDLWLRFVSTVSSYVRQSEVDQLLRSGTPSAISYQQLRKAARDLSANLSLHGYGMAHYAAREVQSQVSFMINLLQDPEILGSYGARDMWQVVDQVATYELGGAKTSSRYRTLATCGTIITAWLANNTNKINRATGPLLDMDQVRNPDVASNHRATRNPSDYDLVNACELWLADTATSDSQVENMAQNPRETPQTTSKPIPIPAMAREMLDGLGDVGLGLGLTRGQAYANGSGGARH